MGVVYFTPVVPATHGETVFFEHHDFKKKKQAANEMVKTTFLLPRKSSFTTLRPLTPTPLASASASTAFAFSREARCTTAKRTQI